MNDWVCRFCLMHDEVDPTAAVTIARGDAICRDHLREQYLGIPRPSRNTP